MAVDNVLFPEDIGYGSQAGPGFRTQVIELASGAEERIARWENPRHRYDVGYGIRTYDALMIVKRFFLARRGALRGFKLKDWQDYATNSTHVLYRASDPAVTGADQPMNATIGTVTLGQGDGTETQFQLTKEYDDDILDYVRNITRPRSGTVIVQVNAVTQTEGVDYTINYQTGVVTFTVAPPAGQTVRWGGEFDVVVRFDESTDEWLNLTFEDFGSGSYPSIQLIELISELETPERQWPGGTKDHGNQTGTSVEVNLVDGRVHRISPQDGSVTAVLQRADDIPSGGPIFYIQNAGSFSMDIDTTDGTLVLALTSGNVAEILITDDGSGGKTYLALT